MGGKQVTLLYIERCIWPHSVHYSHFLLHYPIMLIASHYSRNYIIVMYSLLPPSLVPRLSVDQEPGYEAKTLPSTAGEFWFVRLQAQMVKYYWDTRACI